MLETVRLPNPRGRQFATSAVAIILGRTILDDDWASIFSRGSFLAKCFTYPRSGVQLVSHQPWLPC